MPARTQGTGVSLKWFLIITTVLGAGGGSLYRLLITDPNTFQGFVAILAGPVAVTVLLATAIRSAWRRRNAWPVPECRACGAALKLTAAGSAIACPGCDTEPVCFDQVRFGEAPERDQRALRWIALAVATPLLCAALWIFLFPRGRTYAPVGTSSLIANHLVVDEPWIWSELDLRMSRGELTGAHADAILRVLSAHLAAKLNAGQTLHLPWGSNLIADPAFAAMASDEALAELAVTIVKPSVQADASRYIDNSIDVAVYAPAIGPFVTWPIKLSWEVVEVTAGGESLSFTLAPSRGSHLPGGEVFSLSRAVEAVEIKVLVTAFRGQQRIDGFDALPRSPRATDPKEKPLKTWTLTAAAKTSGN